MAASVERAIAHIDGDSYLRDDFAYATRNEHIAPISRRHDAHGIQSEGLAAPFAEIQFDFVLLVAVDPAEVNLASRPRAEAPG